MAMLNNQYDWPLKMCVGGIGSHQVAGAVPDGA